MQPALETWLVRRATSRRRTNFATAVAGIVLGIAITFLTFWLVYALVWWVAAALPSITQAISGTRVHLTKPWRLGIAGGFLALLVIDLLRRARSEMETEPYPRRHYAPSFGAGGLFVAFAQLLRYPQASSTMIVSLLQTGPRLLVGSCSLLVETMRAIDWSICLPLLEMLVAHPRAVLWEELTAAFPNTDWDSAGKQLRLFDGVVFLEKGLSLSTDFRDQCFQATTTP